MEFDLILNLDKANIGNVSIPTDPEKSGNIQDFVSTKIAEWESDPQRKYMDVCERYYNNKNDITNKVRTVIGRDSNNNPVLEQTHLLANNKLSHNFLEKLTKQKLGYLISKPFTIDPEKADDPLVKDMSEVLKEYFGKSFHKTIKGAAKNSIVKGLGWIQVYYDREGKMKFKSIPPEEVIPMWEDSDHTELSGVIRKFVRASYVNGKREETTFVEYYTRERVFYFKQRRDGKLKVNNDIFPDGISGHYFRSENNQVKQMFWGRVPFIPFKYTSEERPLLARIKELIDDYDKKTSSVSDTIEDIPNSTMVVKGYSGDTKEEFIRNKNVYRTIFVEEGGDANAVDTPLNVTEIDIHLQRLREDIYEFGQGVNTADKDIRDTSGVALRFMYADLDMDCNEWGSELEFSIMSIIWFIQQDLLNKGKGDYTKAQYSVLFSTDVIINETETITNCFTSKGVISDQTIAANHPWTRDVEKEMKGMFMDDEQELKLEAQYGKTPSNTIKGQIKKSGLGE